MISHAKFICPYKTREWSQIPDLFYRYTEQSIKVYNSLQNNDLTNSISIDRLKEMTKENTLTIRYVLDAAYKRKPILIIIASTEEKETKNIDGSNIILFWYDLFSDNIRQIKLDKPLNGTISVAAMTRLPFTLMEKNYQELVKEKHLRHLLVFGKDNDSVIAVLLHDNQNDECVHGKSSEVSLPPNAPGAITALYILPQNLYDKRKGYNDPRILVGTSKGSLQVLRFKALLKLDITVVPSQNFTEFIDYDNEPINYITCVRAPHQRKMFVVVGQNTPKSDHPSESEKDAVLHNEKAYISVIEIYGNHRRKLAAQLSPELLKSYIISTTRIIPYDDYYQITAVFQSTLNKQHFEVDVWTVKDNKVILDVANEAIETDMQHSIQDIWPLKGKSGYMLLYPEKAINPDEEIDHEAILPFMDYDNHNFDDGQSVVTETTDRYDTSEPPSTDYYDDITYQNGEENNIMEVEDTNYEHVGTYIDSEGREVEVNNTQIQSTIISIETDHFVNNSEDANDHIDTDENNSSLLNGQANPSSTIIDDNNSDEKDTEGDHNEKSMQDTNNHLDGREIITKNKNTIEDDENEKQILQLENNKDDEKEIQILQSENNMDDEKEVQISQSEHSVVDEKAAQTPQSENNIDNEEATEAPQPENNMDNEKEVQVPQSENKLDDDEATQTTQPENNIDDEQETESLQINDNMDIEQNGTSSVPLSKEDDVIENTTEKIEQKLNNDVEDDNMENSSIKDNDEHHDILTNSSTQILDENNHIDAHDECISKERFILEKNTTTVITTTTTNEQNNIMSIVSSEESEKEVHVEKEELIQTHDDHEHDTNNINNEESAAITPEEEYHSSLTNTSLNNVQSSDTSVTSQNENYLECTPDEVEFIEDNADNIIDFDFEERIDDTMKDAEDENVGDDIEIIADDNMKDNIDDDMEDAPVDIAKESTQQDESNYMNTNNEPSIVISDKYETQHHPGDFNMNNNDVQIEQSTDINSQSISKTTSNNNEYVESPQLNVEVSSDVSNDEIVKSTSSNKQDIPTDKSSTLIVDEYSNKSQPFEYTDINDLSSDTIEPSENLISSPSPSSSSFVNSTTHNHLVELSPLECLELARTTNDNNSQYNHYNNLFDLIFAHTPLDIDKSIKAIEELQLNKDEETWLMKYCYKNKKPILKLFIMHYNISKKNYNLVLMQKDTMNQQCGTIPTDILNTCNNISKLAEKLVAPVLLDLSIDIIEGNNPFNDVPESGLKRKMGLNFGAELVNRVVKSRKYKAIH
ncbi:unnamed protein product [Cunninghamella blakesleeana]